MYTSFLGLIPLVVISQTIGMDTLNKNMHQQDMSTFMAKLDSLIDINNQWLEQIELNHSLKQRYKLYQTENIYTFFQLDTKTGKIEQVQWSLEEENEGTIIINGVDLSYGYGYGSGSFELYPTHNIYQFILIDKTNGRKWHVQWGIEDNKRWIRRIWRYFCN